MNEKRNLLPLIVMMACIAWSPGSDAPGQEVQSNAFASTQAGTMQILWQPALELKPELVQAGYTLTISGPGDLHIHRDFESGFFPSFDVLSPEGDLYPDGSYIYELTVIPSIDDPTRTILKAIGDAEDRDEIVQELIKTGKLPAERLAQSGAFSILNGAIVHGGEKELTSDPGSPKQLVLDPGGGVGAVTQGTIKDQVILDDLIVDGSACIGFDCVNGESFGFDTIRVKENNLRIKFQDTSNSASFPSNDWQLTANDSSNGGANKFSIDDIDGGRTPFTIEAGARSNSLYVDDGGRVGFGTNTPVVELHTKNGDTPTLRLEQDGSSGFTPQTWDVAGNEAGFFIRDTTNGSTLPFRIIPGASSQSLVIDDDDDIGIGAGTNPTSSLHVRRSDGSAQVFIEETSGTAADRVLLSLANNGPMQVQLEDTSTTPAIWTIQAGGTGFTISKDTGAPRRANADKDETYVTTRATLDALRIENSGEAVFARAMSVSSDVNLKENIENVDGRDVLDRVAELPVSTWNFTSDDAAIRHLGPMAQDFYAAFGLGKDDRHIAPLDSGGVALAAVKGLDEVRRRQEKKIDSLERENALLKDRLEALEEAVKALAASPASFDL